MSRDQPASVSSYTEVRIDFPTAHTEAICDYIIENITPGLVLEEEDGAAVTGIIFYMTADETPTFKPGFEQFLSTYCDDNDVQLPEIREREIQNIQWEQQYRESVRPVLVEDDVIVRPPWHDAAPDRPIDIVIEPKMAFGTGTHETTRSCLSIIRREFREGSSFLDLGCGSGILSILADKLGASKLKAIDYDEEAVSNCRENFALNKVSAPSEIHFGSMEKCDGDEPYDFVCANIIKTTILEMLPRLLELTKGGGQLVLSGLLQQDRDDIIAALHERGHTKFTIWPDNEWHTFYLRKQ